MESKRYDIHGCEKEVKWKKFDSWENCESPKQAQRINILQFSNTIKSLPIENKPKYDIYWIKYAQMKI